MKEYDSMQAALEDAIKSVDIRITDESFGYEYGSISGVHKQIGVELPPQTVEMCARVTAGAGWCWLRGEDEVFRCTVPVPGTGITLHVEASLVEAKIKKLDGFWIVWGIWQIDEVGDE